MTFVKRNVVVNRVKEYRKQAGLTQFELAKKIAVARQTINLVENDKYNPSLDLCLRLAKALHTDLNQLFWEE
ncbi:DNA-binding helix-turn-helix protein [Levilactobacillus brevis ATCC 14869 = DSM 20054]|uniref:DNA-binding helix-turn-helix protein n=1 Tax=Levilactobacillus brevis ATCC 14869 = DSM 20054 TaxID=649758 RepID=U2P209_LEVBR|nr:DNA-binding helix-turn-helix protein [Levilactobacillus brevis ATCC 14869 = DSM 20054]